MIGEQQVGKNLEESDCGLIEVIYLYLRGGSEENHVRRQ